MKNQTAIQTPQSIACQSMKNAIKSTLKYNAKYIHIYPPSSHKQNGLNLLNYHCVVGNSITKA